MLAVSLGCVLLRRVCPSKVDVLLDMGHRLKEYPSSALWSDSQLFPGSPFKMEWIFFCFVLVLENNLFKIATWGSVPAIRKGQVPGGSQTQGLICCSTAARQASSSSDENENKRQWKQQ